MRSNSPHSAERFSVRGRANLRGITIRAVRPDDRERIVKAFRALDPESIYQRFFVFKNELSGEELRRLTESDGVRDVVLVATVASGNQEIIVGLGHCARNEASAEIAFTVAKDYRGRGIASELLQQLTEHRSPQRRHAVRGGRASPTMLRCSRYSGAADYP